VPGSGVSWTTLTEGATSASGGATWTVNHGPLPAGTPGISGSGTLVFSQLFIEAHASGKCTTTKPPVAVQVILKESGSVSLP
jgi:hypothetical protein